MRALRFHEFGDLSKLRVEEIAPSAPVATVTAANLTTLLTVVRGIGPGLATTPEDASMQDLLGSLKVEQKDDRVVLTGTIPQKFLDQLTHPAPDTQPTSSVQP